MWSTWPRSNPHRKKFYDPAISRSTEPEPKPKISKFISQNLYKSEDQITSQSNKVQPFLLIDSLRKDVDNIIETNEEAKDEIVNQNKSSYYTYLVPLTGKSCANNTGCPIWIG